MLHGMWRHEAGALLTCLQQVVAMAGSVVAPHSSICICHQAAWAGWTLGVQPLQ